MSTMVRAFKGRRDFLIKSFGEMEDAGISDALVLPSTRLFLNCGKLTFIKFVGNMTSKQEIITLEKLGLRLEGSLLAGLLQYLAGKNKGATWRASLICSAP
ncbi:hypothetical protein SADUNF_Sadunf17G0070500 [Salix dunnii]|uniref:Uncharacterized protein n=1 Tax=Salix dunnii TaxID=1413687 RepID=A0A835MJW6_9ROSI|nr:hypothetical protein SADUNF_Sadunf17G0070500 [Salix dunnii]